MLPDLKLAVRLQDLDNRAAVLTKEISALPKHIAEIEKKLEGHQRKLEADKAALSGNLRDRKKFEADIQTQEQKISKLKGQMVDAKNNDQYRAFQHEIDFCQKEIGASEDRILELMSESERLESNVKTAEAALKEEKRHVDAEKATAKEQTAADRHALSILEAERKAIVGEVSPAVLNSYERIRKSRGGVAIAEALDGRCSKCHIALRPQFYQELKRDVKVMYCESCNRMLYYNPPQSFENAIGPGQASHPA